MALSPEERARRHRQRTLDKACEYRTSTYCRKFVAPVFQQMIRAEFAADSREEAPAIVDGEVQCVPRYVGECVCVTCGRADAWNSGLSGMHTGHFLSSRRNSILLEEDNVAPQCSHCNRYDSGSPQAFRQWMLFVRGADVVARLERLKTESVSFDREDLVDRKIEYTRRLKAAKLAIGDLQ